MGILTLDNFDVKDKTVLLRVDMNCPIHPDTCEILGTKRIEEVVETINALDGAKIVVISHQGRVGRDDFVGMEEHAKQLEKFSNKYQHQKDFSWANLPRGARRDTFQCHL